MEIPKLKRWQLVQRRTTELEVRLVAAEALSRDEAKVVDRVVRGFLPADCAVTIAYVDDIPRAASGKYEEFVSEV
jgi:hypothetical protein